MKVTLERLPESRVQLDIEVDEERLERSLDAAYRRVAQKARIPGFRPGKAPRNIVERMIGREGLIREALDKLVPDAYNEAIESESVDAVDQPDLEIIELDPVRFKATVPVRPTIDLGDYASVRVEPEKVEVTEEMVQEQVDAIRRRFATQVPVERGIQWGDIVIGDVVATVEDEPFVEDLDAEFPLREGHTLLVEGLAEAFLGLKAEETKEVELDLPDDFQVERFQGKKAAFTLSVKAVKEEQLPDADDDLAQQVNEEEFETFEDLRTRIEDDLRENHQRQADSQLQQEALDQMVEGATIEFPRVLVERELDDIVRESVGNDRDGYLNYLRSIGQSEAEFRSQFEDAAKRRVERSLVLTRVAEAESIEVTDADIEARLDELVEPLGEQKDRMRELFASDAGLESIRRNLMTEKTLARIREIATSPAPKAAKRRKAAAAAENEEGSSEDEGDTPAAHADNEEEVTA